MTRSWESQGFGRLLVAGRAAMLFGGLAALLASCALFRGEQREAWRADAELACFSARLVQESPYVRRAPEIDGAGACGLSRPFAVSALAYASVGLAPAATLSCSMVPSLESWIAAVVQPAAHAFYGVPVAQLTVASSYSCRTIAGSSNTSEHAFANALDVSAFTLVDGRRITVLRGWRGDAIDQAFLRAVHDGACAQFSTVLGPDANADHRDHFHLDLARHNASGTYKVCE